MKKPFLLLLALSCLSAPAMAFRAPQGAMSIDDVSLDPAPEAPKAKETPVTAVEDPSSFVLPGAPRDESSVARVLESYLSSHAAAWGFPAEKPQFRLDYVRIIGNNGFARFVQSSDRLDVDGSQVVFALKFLPHETRVMNTDVHLFPGVRAESRIAPDEAFSRGRVISRLPSRHRGRNLSARGAKVRWIKGRWRAVREFGLDAEGLRAAVDDAGNTVMWRDNLYARDYQGAVAGRGVLFNPAATGNNLVQLSLPDFAVALPGATTSYTDALGAFQVLSGPSAGGPFLLRMTGQWAKVNDAFHPNLTVSVSTNDVNPIALQFNPAGNAEFDTAQVNAYYHVDAVHNWITAHGAGNAGLNVPLPVNLSVVDPVVGETCNAFYSPGVRTLNLFHSGSGCINTAYDTIIYHEYGHFVDDTNGGITNSALSEGWGDLVASYLSGQPQIGEGLVVGNPAGLRSADNTYVYNAFDEAHTQGQAWMGFAWDLRKNLSASMGSSAGVAKAEDLVIPTFLANSPDIPSAVRAVAVLDDDDGNLSNGTPHFADILSAAQKHGVAMNLDFTPPSVSITSPAPDAVLSGQFQVTGTASDNIQLSKVEFRLDGGIFNLATVISGNWSVTLGAGVLLSNGPHTLTARATDSGSNVSTASINITVLNTPPTLVVSSPAPGAVLSGTATISGTASDDEGVFSVSVSTSASPNYRLAVGTAAWTYPYDTRFTRNGPLVISVQAKDVHLTSTISTVAVTISNPPPAVSISTPAVGALLSGVATISGAASSASGLSRVDATVDAVSLVTSGTANWSATFDTKAFSNGSHTVAVRATDVGGNVSTASVTVTVLNTPPSVAISSPSFGATLSGLVTISGTASDDEGVASVQVSTGSGFLPAAGTGTWTYLYDTRFTLNGARTISALATDIRGNTATASLSVTVFNSLPFVSISTPTAGSVLSGVVLASGTAASAAGLAKVEARVDSGIFALASGTSNWSWSLNALGLGNGSHVLEVRATDVAGNSASTTVSFSVNNPGGASYSASFKAPACLTEGAVCQTGSLINGRANISGGAEPNQPNTINNSCADGTGGSFHSDESLDSLRVATLDGSSFGPGKAVTVQAAVWAFSTSDSLDIYSSGNASSPTWSLVGTLLPSSSGAQTLSTTFNLPAGGLQAIRGSFRYQGTAQPCTVGSFDDHDDLVFAVTTSTVPPALAISNLRTSIVGVNAAEIRWDTNAVADSLIRYGTSTALGQSVLGSSPSLTHVATLVNLLSATTYFYQASSTDLIAGTSTSSAILSFRTDDQSPQIAIVSPASTQTISGVFTVSGTASDDLGVALVEWKLNNGVYAPATGTNAWSFQLDTRVIANSNAPTLWLRVTDTTGHQLVMTRTLSINNPLPTVAVVSPAPYGVLSGAAAVSGTASDDYLVNNVSILVDGRNPSIVASGTSTWTATINTPAADDGLHFLLTRVTDAGANFTEINHPVVFQNGPLIQGQASYDPSYKVPACLGTGAACDTGFLTNSKGTMSGASELNQPNTLFGACIDGFGGGYRQHDSFERLRVATVDGNSLSPGKVVLVQGTVIAPNSGVENVDFFHAPDAANPAWTKIASFQTVPFGNKQVFSSSFTLPAGQDVQALRGRVTFSSSTSACPAGVWDTDDMVFSLAPPADTTPPVVMITTPTPNSVVHDDVGIAAAATDDSGTVSQVYFEVRQLTPPNNVVFSATDTVAPYQATWSAGSAANAAYTITARALDSAGNIGSASELVSVGNDITPPVVFITTPAIGANVHDDVLIAATATDDFGAVSRVVFEVRSQMPPFNLVFNSTVTAAPYQATWPAGTSPNGMYSLQASAYDPKGNVGFAGSHVTVANDVTPPVVFITTPAIGANVHDDVLIAATATDDFGVVSRVVFEVRSQMPPFNLVFNSTVTAAPYQATWPAGMSPNGMYSLQVSAYDPKGNVGFAGSHVTVANDVTPPMVFITTPAIGANVHDDVLIAATATDDFGAVSRVVFEVRSQMPPFNLVFNSTVTAAPYQATWPAGTSPNGMYSLQASAYDPKGNVGFAGSHVTVANDVTPPMVFITTPAIGANVHDDVLIAATATDDFGAVSRVVFEVRSQMPPFNLVFNSTVTAAPYQATWAAGTSPNGMYSLQASAYDPKGNVGFAGSHVTVANDVTPPVVFITTPAIGANVHDDVLIAATATDDFGAVSRVVFEVRSQMPPFNLVFNSTVTAAPYQATWPAGTSPNGMYSLQVSAYDPKGNVGFAGSHVTVANDVTPPVVFITTPAIGANVHDDVLIAATATDDFGAVSRVVFEVRSQMPPFNLVFNSTVTAAPYQATWSAGTSPNGMYSLQVSAYDPKGNVGFAGSHVTVANDVTPPVVFITTPVPNAAVHDDVPLAATATDDFGTVSQVYFEVRQQMPPFNVVYSATDTVAPYQATWAAGANTNGAYFIEARAADPKGNVGFTSQLVNLANDVTPPVVSITTPVPNVAVHDDVPLAATATDDFGTVSQVYFEVRQQLPPNNVVFSATDTVAPYQATWAAGAAANGAYMIEARAADLKGNVGFASESVNLANDLTPPVVNITTPAANATVSGTVAFSANAADAGGVARLVFSVDGVGRSTATAASGVFSWNTTSETNGPHVLSVTAFDFANNASQASVSVMVDNRDLTAPTVSVTTPSFNATLVAQVTLTASAADLGGPGAASGVAGVKFRSDGTDLGAEDTSAPYSFSWNTALVANGTHTLTAVARDAAGNVKVSSAVLVNVQNFSAKVNFQPSGSTVPSGYLKDSGASFASRNGFNYGWNATNNNTADRNSSLSLDQRYDTFDRMQTGGTFSWNIAVPNGSYQVRVVAGDANGFNSVFKINVEGVLLVNGTPTSAARWIEGTGTVIVSDGRLTISNAAGANNNKLCFVDILRVAPAATLTVAVAPRSMPVAGFSAGADPVDEDPSRAMAKESFLSPGLQDGVNDAAGFGPAADEVAIFDLRGAMVFHAFQSGSGSISWPCRDDGGRMVESGVYIARVRMKGGKTAYQTLTVAK